jgi:uncharacterized membrane protein
MLITGVILTIIVIIANVLSFSEEGAFYNLALKILNVILVAAIAILIKEGVEKDTSINCLNGKNKYEKQYLIRDSVVIDSVYVLKKEN